MVTLCLPNIYSREFSEFYHKHQQVSVFDNRLFQEKLEGLLDIELDFKMSVTQGNTYFCVVLHLGVRPKA